MFALRFFLFRNDCDVRSGRRHALYGRLLGDFKVDVCNSPQSLFDVALLVCIANLTNFDRIDCAANGVLVVH